jgi:hypothetical protein
MGKAENEGPFGNAKQTRNFRPAESERFRRRIEFILEADRL